MLLILSVLSVLSICNHCLCVSIYIYNYKQNRIARARDIESSNYVVSNNR